MPTRTSHTGSELFIVDNSDEDWKAARYLHEWCSIASSLDVATGYFEVGSMLALDGQWQKLDGLRVLMGEEVSLRTTKSFEAGLAKIEHRLDASLEAAKDADDFLSGVPAIVEAMRSGKLACRVYRKDKFHAKAYITHGRLDVVGSSALVGSSNFTHPGLTQNIELNVQVTGGPVRVLQEWYEEHWDAAEDVTPELLTLLEKHVAEQPPGVVYAQALRHLLGGESQSDTQWDRTDSRIFPLLAGYQREAYQTLLRKARRNGGALLCDGVGLGKTFVGLALIERLCEHERKNVALFVPKAARGPVWDRELRRRLPELLHGYSRLKVFNHTDLNRTGTIADELAQVRAQADVVIIDEAHHFRNTGTRGEDDGTGRSRYWAMHELCGGKEVFLLTATPVNNRMTDLQHVIELFSRGVPDHFARLGIHSLPGHVRQLEKQLKKPSGDAVFGTTDAQEAGRVLVGDELFQELVVQRSRAYVRESMEADGEDGAIFPDREPPNVAAYELKKVYGRLLDLVEAAFAKDKPLFSLPVYNPWPYFTGTPEDEEEVEAFERGRQVQVVTLIRTGFLKRLESSAAAFESSCWNLLQKLMAWLKVNGTTERDRDRLDRWLTRHADLLGYTQNRQRDLFDEEADGDEEDVIDPELLERAVLLDRDRFDVPAILADTYADLEQIVDFLRELKKFQPRNDSKLQALLKLLRNDPALQGQKVLVFSEFMTTARYLEARLKEAGIDGVAEVDSARANADQRGAIIRRFSPYYNGSSPAELAAAGEEETRVLVSTDVLAEGLNLQDATAIVNYDLHWNPVRLMQRIGRVDRRLDPALEARIAGEHPDRAAARGKVRYWNFLPPDELNRLLSLYQKVTAKTLLISGTFGIEGRQLLTPEDDYEAVRNFDASYEGTKTPLEAMKLRLDGLLREHPGLEERLDGLPGRVFSGRRLPEECSREAAAVFFCYRLPAMDADDGVWSLDAGPVRWLLLDLIDARAPVLEDPVAIDAFVASDLSTPRVCEAARKSLTAARKRADAHLRKSYLKRVQAPLDAPKPELVAWMELVA